MKLDSVRELKASLARSLVEEMAQPMSNRRIVTLAAQPVENLEAQLIPPFLLAFELRRRGDWNVWLWIWLVLVTALCAYAVWPGKPSVWVPHACACIGVSGFLGLSALLERRMSTWEAMALSGLTSVAQWLVVFPLIMLLRHLCRLAAPACGC